MNLSLFSCSDCRAEPSFKGLRCGVKEILLRFRIGTSKAEKIPCPRHLHGDGFHLFGISNTVLVLQLQFDISDIAAICRNDFLICMRLEMQLLPRSSEYIPAGLPAIVSRNRLYAARNVFCLKYRHVLLAASILQNTRALYAGRISVDQQLNRLRVTIYLYPHRLVFKPFPVPGAHRVGHRPLGLVHLLPEMLRRADRNVRCMAHSPDRLPPKRCGSRISEQVEISAVGCFIRISCIKAHAIPTGIAVADLPYPGLSEIVVGGPVKISNHIRQPAHQVPVHIEIHRESFRSDKDPVRIFCPVLFITLCRVIESCDVDLTGCLLRRISGKITGRDQRHLGTDVGHHLIDFPSGHVRRTGLFLLRREKLRQVIHNRKQQIHAVCRIPGAVQRPDAVRNLSSPLHVQPIPGFRYLIADRIQNDRRMVKILVHHIGDIHLPPFRHMRRIIKCHLGRSPHI